MNDCETLDDNIDKLPYFKSAKLILSSVVEDENLLVVKIGLCL